jgi:FAD dependent oxidoreductase
VQSIAGQGPEGVVVCGAGAAGLATAIAAARAGAEVCLVEARAGVGGTVTSALIHTLGGLYDSSGEFINDGLAVELAHALMKADASTRRRRLGRPWVLNACPEIYRGVVEQWLEKEKRITVLLNTQVQEVRKEGDRVVELQASTHGEVIRWRPKAIVDATGGGAVVQLADPTMLHDNRKRAAGGLIFSMRGVTPDVMKFPKGLAILRALRDAAEDGRLPAECGKAWVDSGVRECEIYVKLFVPLTDGWHEREARGEITRAALETQAAVIAFLKARTEFEEALVHRTGNLGIRDGGRVRGEYCLSAEDVRESRKFKDAACRACWPIEYWDPDEGVSLEYLPDGSWYEIPLGALKVRGLGNVWAAGKCLSADPLAQASARVVGTCWSMGEAVGKACATA